MKQTISKSKDNRTERLVVQKKRQPKKQPKEIASAPTLLTYSNEQLKGSQITPHLLDQYRSLVQDDAQILNRLDDRHPLGSDGSENDEANVQGWQPVVPAASTINESIARAYEWNTLGTRHLFGRQFNLYRSHSAPSPEGLKDIVEIRKRCYFLSQS